MPGTPENENPHCFARVPLEESVGKLVEVIRRTRPQIVVTYNDDQRGYPHPDHLRVHDVSVAAFDAAGDPDAYPEAGEPWQPAKLYYTVWSRNRIVAMHEKFVELGLESPFNEDWFKRPSQDERITTRIDVSEQADVRSEALLAHATQIDPDSKFWFGLPPEVSRTIYPYEEYVLAGSPAPAEIPEDDLFAGVQDRVSQ
jgi:mycothiol S-conjugate amidase